MRRLFVTSDIILLMVLCIWGTCFSEPILIGLDADLGSGSARSGIAIKRGIILAMEEINSRGGVLGREFALKAMDHRGNPDRGIDNINSLAQEKTLVAIVGGLHTPVALAELPVIHRYGIIYLGPWAAGTPVVKNGYAPNYVFRVSVRDEYAGPFLVQRAVESGYGKPGLLLEQTGWGRSNSKAMTDALAAYDLQPSGPEWFLWGTTDFSHHISALKEAGADVILFVGNAPEGVALTRSMAGLASEERLPVLSHWGITGGEFFSRARSDLAMVDLKFLQTYSFLNPPFPDKAARLFAAYRKKWPETESVREIFAPAGTAHAYDLIFLLRAAIQKAGTTDRKKVRNALETISRYQGLVKDYRPPFTPENHDALSASDFQLARFAQDGAIEPVDR